MNENTRYHKLLVQRFVENKCTEEELEVFFHLMQRGELDEFLIEDMKNYSEVAEGDPASENTRPRIIHWKWVAAAAAIFIFIVTGIFLNGIKQDERKTAITDVAPLPHDKKPPTSTRATITLSNGQIISIDSVGKGQLAIQGKVDIIKLDDGGIVYRGSASETVFNTLTNPMGSKVIDMKLADGSRLWLNAGSSATYPVAFTGSKRKISITGEAYFEVAKDAARPFVVSVNQMEIEVLGTHFNVNGYADESLTRTTLLEGSILIRADNTSRMLKPGQQALLKKSGDFSVINDADIEEAIAWKEGNFQFENTDIHDAMRQVARWYDVEIEYSGIVSKHLVGTISRSVNLSQVLNMLQQSAEVKFSVEGRKIIVMP